jgi:hypothetical protein
MTRNISSFTRAVALAAVCGLAALPALPALAQSIQPAPAQVTTPSTGTAAKADAAKDSKTVKDAAKDSKTAHDLVKPTKEQVAQHPAVKPDGTTKTDSGKTEPAKQ